MELRYSQTFFSICQLIDALGPDSKSTVFKTTLSSIIGLVKPVLLCLDAIFKTQLCRKKSCTLALENVIQVNKARNISLKLLLPDCINI